MDYLLFHLRKIYVECKTKFIAFCHSDQRGGIPPVAHPRDSSATLGMTKRERFVFSKGYYNRFTFLFNTMDDNVFADLDPSPVPTSRSSGGSEGNYSNELFSKKIQGRQRTFFLDLKESTNGKFVKVSELSRGGQRSTIMFDAEDVEAFIQALQEIKASL